MMWQRTARGWEEPPAWRVAPVTARRSLSPSFVSLGLWVSQFCLCLRNPRVSREEGARGRNAGSQGAGARRAVHTRHRVVAESPARVRRRRPRLPARCEGAADGEEEGVGRRPGRCQISCLRRNHHHGDRGRQEGPSPTLFRDPRMSSSASYGGSP